MEWSEVKAQLPQDKGSVFRRQILEHLRDRTAFKPEGILKKVVILSDAQGRRMLWGIGSSGVQNLYLGAELAGLLPPDILKTLPTKLHSARRTYLDAYEGPAIELRRPEDLVLLDALGGSPFDRAVDGWIARVRAKYSDWTGFEPPDPSFDAEERAYKLGAAEILTSALAQAVDDSAQLDALANALKATNLLQWRVYWPISAKGDADRPAMARAAARLLGAATDAGRHPEAVAGFIEAWMQHCPNPQRDAARQIACYALMLLNPDQAIFLRRSLLDAMYYEATGTRFPRGEAMQEYRAEIDFATRVRTALAARGLAPRDLIDVQSLLWVAFRSDADPINDLSSSELSPAPRKDDVVTHPLNTILFGPPGTGKTYATQFKAVSICDGEEAAQALSPEKLKARYAALREAGRIAFVTFHQSFSYEDFVEGLRPITEDGHAGFRLVPTPGILRKMADLAAKGRAALQSAEVLDLTNRGVFKMSLGRANSEDEAYLFQECIDEGYVLLGYGGEIDWSDKRFDEWGEILKELQKIDSTATGYNPNLTSIYSFRNDIRVGDFIIVSNGNLKFRAIGEVTGPYQFISRGGEDEYHHRRAVRWLWQDDTGLPAEGIIQGQFSQRSVYRIPAKKVKGEALAAYIAPAAKGERLPHVLVIDEINRANVSKVFGELITLLEEDKREGAMHAVTLRLPYSGDEFSLPANLHILGTMNTADRSIALLDTALRRRFHFEEMPPQASRLGHAEGLDLGLLLTRLNERIEYLYDRDHLIGHAFFMAAKTRAEVDRVMRRKVIPLLAEYFHEDWARIIAVLGGPAQGFIEQIPLPRPPGLDSLADEPRFRYSVKEAFEEDAYAGLQM